MRYLISFNESFRVESIRSDVEQMFWSEVDDEGFKIYCGDAWRGELVFTIQKEEQGATFTLVDTFKLGELEGFISRLFRWAEMSPCSMVVSYLDRVSFEIVKERDLVSLGDKTVSKLIIRLSVFQ